MSRQFVRASAQYMERVGAPVSGLPITLAVWLWTVDTTNQQDVFSVSQKNAAGRMGYIVRLDGSVAGDPVSATSSNAGVAATSASTTAPYNINSWNHCACVFASTTDRRAYVNGAGKAVDTTSNGPGVPDRVMMGAIYNGNVIGTGTAFDGLAKLPAVWKDVLTDSEILQLAMGAHPRTVRPDALVAYWELAPEGATSPSLGIGSGVYPFVDNAGVSPHRHEPPVWNLGNPDFANMVNAIGDSPPWTPWPQMAPILAQ